MLRLRSSVAHHRAEEFGALLRGHEGVRRVVQQTDEAQAQSYVFVADVEPSYADVLVEKIAEIGIPVDDYVLTKMEVVAPQHRHKHGEGQAEQRSISETARWACVGSGGRLSSDSPSTYAGA